MARSFACAGPFGAKNGVYPRVAPIRWLRSDPEETRRRRAAAVYQACDLAHGGPHLKPSLVAGTVDFFGPSLGLSFCGRQAIPKIAQETLADMIGTTRSRVNFFMNKFKRLGFIDTDGGSESTCTSP
jgi:Crp-like helix-turn-helix domain